MIDLYADSEISKTPICSVEAEQAVLGGLIIDPNRFCDVTDLINELDFYDQGHQIIFTHIRRIIENSETLDIITLSDALDSANELDNIGGIGYLSKLNQNTPSTANIAAYAKVVRDKSTERKLLTASVEISNTAYNPDLNTEEKVIQSQGIVLALESSSGEEVAQANSAIRAVIDQIDERFSGGEAIGVRTGLKEIDDRHRGLRASDLIILAARPAMGKTAFAMGIAGHQVLVEKKPVLVFSMEMSKEQLMERMVSSASNIPFSIIRSGKLRDEHWPQLTSGVSRLKDTPLYIDDRGALSINQMRSTARKMHKKIGLSLIIVDYLQLAKAKASSREQEISQISGGLKALAKELNIPILALSQLSRECEKGPNKRPQCHHLRDSGSIEQDADAILFLYRDEVYNENSQHKGITEVITGKFRNGCTGTDFVASKLDVMRFDDLSHDVPEIINEPPRKFRAA